jgi:hypothetical protein
MEKFEGVPYGLFLGPKVSEWFPSFCPRPACDLARRLSTRVAVLSFLQELEEVGGLDELEKELARISRAM